MLLIHADNKLNDIRTIKPSYAEFAFGVDENDFELVMPQTEDSILPFDFIYYDGTEYGGMVTSITNDPDGKRVIYNGPTWHGLLCSKVLEPDEGKDYLTVSGEVNSVIDALIKRIGLDGIFSAASSSSGLIADYQFSRYVTAFDGIRAMLSNLDQSLVITCANGKANLSLTPIRLFDAVVKTTNHSLPINHLICLGEGELKDRTVIHLYADGNGNISQTRTFSGVYDRSEVYDYSNANSEKLIEDGKKKLKEYQIFKEAELVSLGMHDYRIDDIACVYDSKTDTIVEIPINKKIVSINHREEISTTYEAGDVVIRDFL